MRDWYLPLSPIVTIGYFLAFPNQFTALVDWALPFVR